MRQVPRFGWLAASLGDGFGRLSYDLPFIVRGHANTPPACIVYIDEGSARALHERLDPWNRELHAQLVRRLTQLGARAVLFDVVFSEPWPDSAVDEDFAAAIREHGRVFIGAALEVDESVDVVQERVVPPIPVLRRAAAGWGLLAFRPVDADYGVRRIYAGTETVGSATWVAARALGASIPNSLEERSKRRWINYYSRAAQFPSVSYERALAPDGPPELFRDRIVVIGGRSTLGGLRLGKDDFRSPYGLLGAEFLKGPEVHLTTLLNLLEGEWLTRIGSRTELLLVLAVGLLLGGGLPWLRPHLALFGTTVTVLALAVGAVWLFSRHHIWFAWCIPAFAQAPVALVWAVGTRYFIEERRRTALRDAFAHYLSAQMADRIADADFDLSLGGTVVEVTVMFTDLENFAPLSEELEEPERISEVLTTYFTHTTGHILDNDGTILKYLGDSVQAVWGAPLPDREQVRKAVSAAWKLHLASVMEVQGHPLRTRIGLNTGMVLAGNLGSAQRFDYAVTGDEVNFASRLEGMNKQLGTNILISDSVQRQIEGEHVTRCVGEFRVVGKKKARVIYELLGPTYSDKTGWPEAFAGALQAFRRGDFGTAESGMSTTKNLRGGHDGPSEFYLAQIATLRGRPLPNDWSGIVELTSK